MTLGDRLRRLIQARVDETGSPQADDAKCSGLKLKYGSSADVAADHGERVARQIRTLCPSYFVPLGRSEETDTPPLADRRDGAYTDSKDLCGIFGVEQVASEYGGSPADPASVAQAYANESYQASFRESAQEGCLAGLTK